MNTPVTYRENATMSTNAAFELAAVRLVLWDLDGVLFHTLPVMQLAWQRVRDEYRISALFDDYAEHLGRPFADILQLLGLELPHGQSARIEATYRTASAEHSHLAEPSSGMVETLHRLAADDLIMGVVTSKSRETAVPLLDRLACPFAVVRTAGRERGKPAPDPLLLAVTDVGVDPAEAVYIGDMAVDEQAARRAGIPYVHAGWGYGAPETPGSLVLSEPNALITLIAGQRGQYSEVSPREQ